MMAGFNKRQKIGNTSSAFKTPYDVYGGQYPKSRNIDDNYDSLLCDDYSSRSFAEQKNNTRTLDFIEDYSRRDSSFEDINKPLSPEEFFSNRRAQSYKNSLNNNYSNTQSAKPLSPEEFRQKIDYRGKNKQSEKGKKSDYSREYKKQNERVKSKNRRVRALVLLIILSMLMVAVYFVFNDLIFTAKQINIDGISKYTYKDILTLTKIKENQSLSAIDAKEVENRINRVSDLELIQLKFIYPNGLYIKVLERTPVAIVSSNGYYYSLDKDANVIKRSDSIDDTSKLIHVTNCNMIQNVAENKSEIRSQWQKDAYINMFNALYDLGFSDKYSMLSLSKEDSLYIYSCDGFVINLGDSNNIVSKLAVSNSVREYLIKEGKTEGRIDVSMPEKPIFASEENRVLYDPKYELEMSPLDYEKLYQQINANP